MPTPNLTISSTSFSGYALVTLTSADLPGSPIAISAITNENSASSSIVETPFSIMTSGASPVAITSIRLDSSLLPLGKKTFVFVRYIFSDNSILDSNVLLISNNSVAQTPVLTVPAVIRPEDRGMSINIGSLYTLNSTSDGFSQIDKVIVNISKVSTTANPSTTADFMVRQVDIDSYDTWYSIGASDLDNASDYEVSFSIVNGVSITLMSNTVVIQPLDTASQMTAPKAYSLLTYQQLKAQTLNDTRGDIAIFFNRPSDYDTLAGAEPSRKVLKYKLYEQEFAEVPTTDPQTFVVSYPTLPVGAPTQYNLDVPLTGLASFELSSSETVEAVSYKYKYIIPGSASKLGKKFKYTIAANNVNGDGPISLQSNLYCYSFIQSEMQLFSLNHNNVISILTGSALKLYDGKMSISIGQLSALGGASEDSTSTSQVAVNSTTNGNTTIRNAYAIKNVKFHLKIATDVASPDTKFDGKVTFIQDYTTSAPVITGTVNVNQVTTTTITPQPSYTLKFEDVDTDSGTNGVQSLDTKLDKGIKYRFTLRRISYDPNYATDMFYSNANETVRTKFSSPNAVNEIQSYGINDDFTPVSTLTEPKLRLVFNQLTPGQLNGMAAFNSEIKYFGYQQSLPVSGLAPIVHDTNISSNREFIIPQIAFGGSASNYIRSKSFNPELNEYIDGSESTPAVVESAIIYPQAVTGLTITKASSTSMTVSFIKQASSVTALGGSPTAAIQNSIVVWADNVLTPVYNQSVSLNSGTQSVTISSGLTAGSSYIVAVIAERVYTKDNVTSGAKRFVDVLVRSNYVKKSVVMSGIPGPPTNIELFPSDSKITMLYDSPTSGLEGIDSSTLRYHIYGSYDVLHFPTNTSVSPNVTQASIADVSGSSEAIITQAFRTYSASSARANSLALQNDSLCYISMRVIGTIGGNSLVKTSYISEYSSGTFLGSAQSNNLNVTINAMVPTEEVIGTMSSVKNATSGNGIPVPESVSVLPQDAKLKVTWKKDNTGAAINNVIITLAKNDALDNTSAPIAAFDTTSLATVYDADLGTVENPSGLYLLESYYQTASIATNASAFVKYSFEKSTNANGETFYEILFTKLTNGIVYEVEVRNSKTNPDGSFVYSEPFSLSRAAEAPPTIILTPTFSVDSNKIVANWSLPENSGGANIGGNGPLRYKVQLSNSAGALPIIETSLLSHTIDSLVNGTSYTLQVAGFYVKSTGADVVGPFTQINTDAGSGNVIKPNAAPVSSSITSVVNGNNSMTINFVTAGSSEQQNYPLSKIQVWVIDKAIPANKVCVEEFPGVFTGTNSLQHIIASFTAKSGTANTIGQQKPLNGYNYDVSLVHIPSYKFAQKPEDKVIAGSPMGQLKIISSATKIGTNTKIFTINVNLNGSGSINNIIGLAKAGASILTNNLSIANANLPTITTSGSMNDSATGNYPFVAAGQQAVFDLSFATASVAVSDYLTVVVSQNSSDVHVSPTATEATVRGDPAFFG